MNFTRTALFSLLAVVVGLLIGCGDGNGTDSEPGESGNGEQAAAPQLTTPQPMQDFEDDGDVAEITIEGNDRMRFDIDQFEVAPGQMVRLTLEHVGNLPAASMGHNVVIVQQGEDAVDFGAEANAQGANMDNNFVPEPVRDRVIAYTAMIGGGQTAVVEFRAPDEPGEYPFLCSFTGHYGQMRGHMVVE